MNFLKIILIFNFILLTFSTADENEINIVKKEIVNGLETIFVSGLTYEELKSKYESYLPVLEPKLRYMCVGKIKKGSFSES